MTEMYSAKHWSEKARKQAVGTLAENSEGSAKHWAEQAKASMNNAVNLDNTQTITGSKTFINSITNKSSTYDSVNAGSAIQYYTAVNMRDKNNVNFGNLLTSKNTNGDLAMSMQSQRNLNNQIVYATMSVYIQNDGATFATCPTPKAVSNDNSIATTEWVRKCMALNYGSVLTLSGAGTRTAPYDGVLIATPTNSGGNDDSDFGVTINGQYYRCSQGYYGMDYCHVSQAIFPFKSGDTYTVNELNNCTLRYIKRGV